MSDLLMYAVAITAAGCLLVLILILLFLMNKDLEDRVFNTRSINVTEELLNKFKEYTAKENKDTEVKVFSNSVTDTNATDTAFERAYAQAGGDLYKYPRSVNCHPIFTFDKLYSGKYFNGADGKIDTLNPIKKWSEMRNEVWEQFGEKDYMLRAYAGEVFITSLNNQLVYCLLPSDKNQT